MLLSNFSLPTYDATHDEEIGEIAEALMFS